MTIPYDPDKLRAALSRGALIDPAGVARRAAVAAILREEGGDTEVLLVRRSRRPSDPWSGHMAFPGGRHEPEDRDLLQTATRETMEEIGLDLDQHAELVGRLDDIQAVARGQRLSMSVAAFVFRLRSLPALHPNDEIDAVVWASIQGMRSDASAASVSYPVDGTTLTLPGFQVGEDIVWGLTHRMLTNLFAALDAAAPA